jgi:hypothetical protein
VSQENVEVVRACYQALNAGDMVGALAALDSGIEIVDHDLPDATESYRGLDGVGRWQADWEASGLAGAGSPRSSSIRMIVSSRSSGSTPKGAGAVWMSNASMARFGPSETANAFDSITTGARLRPSNPWGWGSRRCRRRTGRGESP